MKGCEPRDLLNKVNDICVFEGRGLPADAAVDRSGMGQLLRNGPWFRPDKPVELARTA